MGNNAMTERQAINSQAKRHLTPLEVGLLRAAFLALEPVQTRIGGIGGDYQGGASELYNELHGIGTRLMWIIDEVEA